MLRIALILGMGLSLFADDELTDQFAAKQLGNNIELNTPFGPRLLWGDDGFNAQTNYRIEIPIEDLKSKEQKAEEERRRREAEKQRELASVPPTSETKIIEKEREIIKEVDREKESEKHKTIMAEDGLQAIGSSKKLTVEYDETDRFILEANRLYNRGKFYEASLVVDELLRRKPDLIRGWVMKGSLLHVQGHKDRAKVAWQTAIRLDPTNQELKKILDTYK